VNQSSTNNPMDLVGSNGFLVGVNLNSAGPSSNAQVALSSGIALYTPNNNFAGVDTFPYRVCVALQPDLCATANVTVTVRVVVNADSFDLPMNGQEPDIVRFPDASVTKKWTLDVLQNDGGNGQGLTIQSVSAASHGYVNLSVTTPKVITYTPGPLYVGTDSFTYTACVTASPGVCQTTRVDINIRIRGASYTQAVTCAVTNPNANRAYFNLIPKNSPLLDPASVHLLTGQVPAGVGTFQLVQQATCTSEFSLCQNCRACVVYTPPLCSQIEEGSLNAFNAYYEMCQQGSVTQCITGIPSLDDSITNYFKAAPILINLAGAKRSVPQE